MDRLIIPIAVTLSALGFGTYLAIMKAATIITPMIAS